MGIENRLREFSKISVDFRKFTEISGNPQGVFCLLKITALSHFRKFAEIVDMIIFFDLKYSQRDFRNPQKPERYFRPTRMVPYYDFQSRLQFFFCDLSLVFYKYRS